MANRQGVDRAATRGLGLQAWRAASPFVRYQGRYQEQRSDEDRRDGQHPAATRLGSCFAVAGWIGNAIRQVRAIDREAREEGYPAINDLAKENAINVLMNVARHPVEPAIYPSMDGEIAIYFKSRCAAAAFLVLLNNDGGAGTYWSVDGRSQRKRFDGDSGVPRTFLSRRLQELEDQQVLQSR